MGARRAPAVSLADPMDEATSDASAAPATSEATDPTPPGAPVTDGQLRITRRRTRTSGESGSATTESASGGTTLTSPDSAVPSKGSTERWRRPRHAKGLAAQVNTVMTMVLNGEIDTDAARLYSSLGRTLAQVLSAEVYQARFMARAADLSLEESDE